jgi:hypothetical protein
VRPWQADTSKSVTGGGRGVITRSLERADALAASTFLQLPAFFDGLMRKQPMLQPVFIAGWIASSRRTAVANFDRFFAPESVCTGHFDPLMGSSCALRRNSA